MKFSEGLRKGYEMVEGRQSWQQLARYTVDDKGCLALAVCAIGADAVAMSGLTSPSELDKWVQENHSRYEVRLAADRADCPHPLCLVRCGTIGHMAMHLNDGHHMPIPAIADFFEELGF
jgi:hypothetical protein